MLIPTSTEPIVEPGTTGVSAWAVQRGLNERGAGVTVLAEDGVYGAQTTQVVKNFQARQGLDADGRFGQATGDRLTRVLSGRLTVDLPGGIIRSMIENESAMQIAAVNWSVAGGVDCGLAQRRVYEGDYNDEAVVHRAFDPLYQFKLLANSLRGRHDAFIEQPGAKTNEKAWRLAALNHNYPSGAKKIAEVGVSGLGTYWTTPQGWVLAIGAEFPDGVKIQTPLEWCQHYALGDEEHDEPGAAVKHVTSWPS